MFSANSHGERWCWIKAKTEEEGLEYRQESAFSEKLESTSATILSEKYGIGKSTIIDIKRNQKQILEFKWHGNDKESQSDDMIVKH